MPSLSIIVLAYDEAANVGPVLAELKTYLQAHEPDAEIVFVDDGSRDGTSERAEAALVGFPHTLVRHRQNRGIGAALKSGVRAAKAPWATFLPADGQIDPQAIGTLRAAAERERADVVLSVYDQRDDGAHRKLLSAGVRGLITLVHGVVLHSDGPYLFRRKLFAPEQLPPDTFFVNFEFPIRAKRAGLRMSQVTIACRPRLGGHSKTAKLRVIAKVGRELLGLRARTTRELLGQLR